MIQRFRRGKKNKTKHHVHNYAATSVCTENPPPEGDRFEGPLGHSAGLLDLGGLQVMGHVLEPQQGAVGGGEEETLEGGRVLGPQARIHQLSFPLYQGLFRLLFLLLKLVSRFLLGLEDKEGKKSGESEESNRMLRSRYSDDSAFVI